MPYKRPKCGSIPLTPTKTIMIYSLLVSISDNECWVHTRCSVKDLEDLIKFHIKKNGNKTFNILMEEQ